MKILCLGDSITQSGFEYCGYRYILWKKLIDAKINFDFVGSIQHRFRDTSTPCSAYKGKNFDRDHEGHWAWQTNHFFETAKRVPGGSGSGTLSEWLKDYTPGIVLLHLGHNDTSSGEHPHKTAGEIMQLISILRQDNPEVSVLLAKVIPTKHSTMNSALESLNSQMDSIAADMTTAKSKITVIDMYTGFDGKKDTFDGIHPNLSGSEKMAQKWFEGIMRIAVSP